MPNRFGFLQRFRADDFLIEVTDTEVTRYVQEKAIELAMLGLVDQCNAICQVLAKHGQFDSAEATLALQCIWFYSGSQPPDIQDSSEGAVWVPSKEDIRKKDLEARKRLLHLPEWMNWDSFDANDLENMKNTADKLRKERGSGSWTGYTAMRVSNMYAATIHMASDLGQDGVIADLMPLMARRIHAAQQAHVLSLIPSVWRDYMLKGWLREQLSLTEEALREYADFVSDTTKDRFEHGARRPEEIYPGFTVPELLEVVDQNTISSTGYAEYLRRIHAGTGIKVSTDNDDNDNDDDDSNVQHHSIMHPGATADDIEAAERRMNHKLPDDIKRFFMLSNGCDPIRVGEDSYRLLLPPLDQLNFEDEDYMRYYDLNLVPGLPHRMNIEWPENEGGGIAMYEHDGQGTQYVWIMDAEQIKRSKDKLQEAYDEASDDDKAIIDRHIRYWYGDRETFDAMTDYCYLERYWGDPRSAIYPDFKSYLARMACDSRHYVERSPLEVEYDE